jgi:flagellar hook assembly protein FlgD
MTFTITQTHTVSPTITVSPTVTVSSTITPTASPTPDVIAVYPNPCSLTKAVNKTVKFDFLPDNTRIKIYNIQGYKVTEFGNLSGKFEWNCINMDGEKVSPGIYLYDVEGGGKTFTGKLYLVK